MNKKTRQSVELKHIKAKGALVYCTICGEKADKVVTIFDTEKFQVINNL